MRLAILVFFSGVLVILVLSRLPRAEEFLGVFSVMGICAAIMLPLSIATQLLWDSPWWHAVAPPLLYGR